MLAVVLVVGAQAPTPMAVGGPGLHLSETSLAFGPRMVGTTSPEIVDTLTDTTAEPMVIRAIEVVGRDRDDFATPHGWTPPITVAAGSSLTLSVSFTPTAPWKPGTRRAILKIEHGGSGDPRDHDGDAREPGEPHGRDVTLVPLSGMGITCAGPILAADSDGACADTDGDGFNDVWEDNGYIDLNNNGKPDAEDFHFPSRQSHMFSNVQHTGTGTSQLFPTVTDAEQPVDSSTVVVTIVTGGFVGTATFQYSTDGRPIPDLLTTRPVVDLKDNLRLLFYAEVDTFVAGDTYRFSTTMGEPLVAQALVRPFFMIMMYKRSNGGPNWFSPSGTIRSKQATSVSMRRYDTSDSE